MKAGLAAIVLLFLFLGLPYSVDAAGLAGAPGFSEQETGAAAAREAASADAQPPAQPAHGEAASAQQEHGQAGHGEAQQGEAGHGEEHAESPWVTLARLANFAILAGTLIYFVRSPFAQHLVARATEIRKDLSQAAEARKTAEAQIAEVDRRLAALPAELEELRRRGEADIAADRARISEAASAEREALLAQARREIDMKLRIAEQSLVRRTGELAIALARERIKRDIRDEDQARLLDTYLGQIGRN